MPLTVETVRTVPLTGNGRCSSNDCSACTSWARSKSPRLRAVRAWEIRTAKVGSTCWVEALRVLRRELQLAERIAKPGPDTHRVQKRVGRRPGPLVRLSRFAHQAVVECHDGLLRFVI